jgi:hypothetical protein
MNIGWRCRQQVVFRACWHQAHDVSRLLEQEGEEEEEGGCRWMDGYVGGYLMLEGDCCIAASWPTDMGPKHKQHEKQHDTTTSNSSAPPATDIHPTQASSLCRPHHHQ